MKKKNKEKKWHASVKKSVFCMAACLTLAGLAKPWDVHAAVLGEDMKQGNILELQSGRLERRLCGFKYQRRRMSGQVEHL